MRYEIIREIKNCCQNNQMRDVFFEELELSDPDAWIRAQEPFATSLQREDIDGGIRYYVDVKGMTTVYNLTEVN